MNEKRNLSLALLILIIAAFAFSLVSCGGGGGLPGSEVDESVSYKKYNAQTDLTTLNVDILVTNGNPTRAVSSYKYKVVFRNSQGAVISTKIFTEHIGILPSGTENHSHYFSESDGTAIRGSVAIVEAFPIEMSLSDKEVESPSGSTSSPSGTPKWGFWAWFWVILCGILVALFFIGCVGAEWDSSAVIGGIIVCIVPAIIILVVYFGFVFGSGV